jgi:hypothetical protein
MVGNGAQRRLGFTRPANAHVHSAPMPTLQCCRDIFSRCAFTDHDLKPVPPHR